MPEEGKQVVEPSSKLPKKHCFLDKMTDTWIRLLHVIPSLLSFQLHTMTFPRILSFYFVFVLTTTTKVMR